MTSILVLSSFQNSSSHGEDKRISLFNETAKFCSWCRCSHNLHGPVYIHPLVRKSIGKLLFRQTRLRSVIEHIGQIAIRYLMKMKAKLFRRGKRIAAQSYHRSGFFFDLAQGSVGVTLVRLDAAAWELVVVSYLDVDYGNFSWGSESHDTSGLAIGVDFVWLPGADDFVICCM